MAVVSVAFLAFGSSGLPAAPGAGNLFPDPGFEIAGPGSGDWRLDRGGATEAEFAVDRRAAAEGERSALVRIGRVAAWGAQFGRAVAPGRKGGTYTFAVMARAEGAPVTVDLQIERSGKPYDRAAKGGPFTVSSDRWTELHVTFTVEKDFPQGWFAYIGCTQSNCAYRADAFRLYEGAYVPFETLTRVEDAATGVGVTESADGALCASNHLLSLTVRKGAAGAEIRYRLGGGMPAGPRLAPAGAGGARAGAVSNVRVVEHDARHALLETRAAGAAGGGEVVARYLLRRNQPLVEVQAGDGMVRLRVETRSRYAVVPDILGGDLVVDAASGPGPTLRLPSENVLAQLAGGGEALVACAWRSGTQAVRLELEGRAAERAVAAAEIECRPDLPVAVAVLAGPGIWHAKKVAELDPVKDVKLDGPVPYPALWRADFRREDGLVDSWRVVIRKGPGEWEGFGVSFTKPKARTVWTSARGTFAYPAYLDGRDVFLRRSRFEEPPGLAYRGEDAALVYPLQRTGDGPTEAWGVLDVLRAALAGTPEEKRLDEWVIQRVPRDRYPATCAVTAEYEAAFDDGKEKEKRPFLLQRLDEMDRFVTGIRGRMEEYEAWRRATCGFIAAQKAAHPALAAAADDFDGTLARFDRRYEALKLAERTPAAAKVLIARVVALIDSPAPDKAEQAKQIGRETRTLGGSQDHAIGDYRMIVKDLRQRAGIRMAGAADPEEFEFAREVRERTREVLRCGFGHEGAFTE